MGILGYFRRRRRRESAVESLELTAEPSADLAPLSAVFGAGTEAPPDASLAAGIGAPELGQIAKLIASAAKDGNVQVHVGEPQEIDMSGTDLGDEIRGILARYGVEPSATTADGIDAARMLQMQQEIMDAIAGRGVALPGSARDES